MQRGLLRIVVPQVSFLVHGTELVLAHAVMDGELVVGDIYLGFFTGLNLEISLAHDVACLPRVGAQVGFVDCNIATLSILDPHWICLLYTSDAADDLLCVDLGGRRIIKKKKKQA